MSQNDTRDTGIPTRAIHEAYIGMQHAHRQFRDVAEDGEDIQGPQGVFQDAVLTFYELIRPHLKHESGLSDYWKADIPDYTGWDFTTPTEAADYIREKGTGVYQVQRHTDVVHIQQGALTDGGVTGFDDWHEMLGLSWDTERLVSIHPANHEDSRLYYISVLRIATLPLRQLDHWQAVVRKERSQGTGFMAGETATETRLEFQPPVKLVTAKRLLVEAADDLGLLSEVEASTVRTEITREDIKKVEQWRQQQIQ